MNRDTPPKVMRRILAWLGGLFGKRQRVEPAPAVAPPAPAAPPQAPADEVRALLEVLQGAGVESFEGCGVKVVFRPPAGQPRAPTEITDPAVLAAQRLTAVLGRARSMSGM